MKKFTLMTSAAAIALAGLSVSTVSAQESEQSVAGRDVITVTARRREESLLDAPVAVSAFGADEIESLGIQSVDDVARFTPGLSFSSAFGRSTERPVIRGQANVLAGVQFGVESGTAYFVDGIYFPATIQNLDPNDIERVEVIKGPQSALYGRNTYAGAINFVTRGATDEFEANAEARMGSYGERDLSLRISGPMNDRMGYSLSVRDYSYDGEWTNTLTGRTVGSETTFAVSGVLDIRPNENWDIRGRVSYNDDDDGTLPLFLQPSESNNCMPGYRSNAYWPRSGSTNTNQYYCGVIAPAPVALNTDAVTTPRFVDGVPGNATYSRFSNLFFLPPFSAGTPYDTNDGTAFDGIDRQQILASLKADWDVGGSGYVASFAAAFRDEEDRFGSDSDHSAVSVVNPLFGSEPFFANTNRGLTQDYSLEFKFASPTDNAVRWMVGGFYYHQDEENFDITFADLEGTVLDSEATTENRAIFGLAEWDITPSLTATVEARYAEEDKEVIDLPFSGTASFSNFTPRLTLDWSPNANTTIYGVFAQGVKPGGLNGDAGNQVGQPTYDQETSDNFELGYKRSVFDGAALLTLAGYYTDATDVQLTTAIGTPSGALTSIATNQGSAEIWGIEASWNHQLTDQFNYGLTYAWTNPEFTEGCDDFQWSLTSGGGLIAGNATAPGTGNEFFGNTGNCSIAGNKIPLTSEHQFSGNFEYRMPIGNSGQWEAFLQTDLTYESSKFVQVHNLAETGDTTLLGARIGFESDDFTFLFWGENLTNEDSIIMATRWLQTPYFTFASQNIAPLTADRGAPRAFFGTLRKGPAVGIEARLRF